jgi:aspartyl protease family protein
MPSARTKQCPACWSTLDLDEARCPQCDAALKPQGRNKSFIAVLLIVLAAGAAGFWALQRQDAGDAGKRTGENKQPVVESDPDRGQTQVNVAARTPSEGSGSPAEAIDTPFVQGFGADSRNPVVLVALQHDGPNDQMHFCIPAMRLPTREKVVTADGTPFTAITWERRSDLVLLLGPRPDPMPEGLVPVSTRDSRTLRKGEELTVVTPDGPAERKVRQTGFGNHMQFTGGIPPICVVVDADGRGLALGVDWSRARTPGQPSGSAGLPIHALDPWKDWWNGRPLAEVQKEIRAADPDAILADARALLDSKETTIERAELALEFLTKGQHLARDRVGIAAFDRLIRFAHLQRIRLLSEVSGVRALQQARESLNILGPDPDLLSDAAELAMDFGEPADALSFYQSLLATSSDHAKKIKAKLGRKLRQKVETMLKDRRNQDAARLLADAILSLPERADLRMLYARALSSLGDRVSARIQADQAALLDPSYAADARRYARSSNSASRGSRRVEIPYDKRSSSILVAGSASGQGLSFIVDTGATYTMIPSSIAKALNLLNSKNPVAEVTTAGIVVKAQQVVLPSLTIAGKITVRNVTALVYDMPGNLGDKGLLGLNVLRGLNMQMDSRRGRLILSQPSSKRR